MDFEIKSKINKETKSNHVILIAIAIAKTKFLSSKVKGNLWFYSS
ncbi:Hypothetical protein LEPBI_I0230 [Leptospira biflexa serovar Patoc strain 'Patoc 1 (Paris)']|uniref:Uncharacterized protein n=1 Tax=Leptospira biflexa serovar Patoc (strain Patoc 1 / ATCC 23582 / Paris) TaxID=456481 RepID=B0SKC3_LEPBP|nr:Hypothetical protein LEPBI_I0230 [Leptospira biflexa serovar Patoc strain 'Patoc 1 (Paris)']